MKKDTAFRVMVALLLIAICLCSAALAESYAAGTMRLLHAEGEVQILDASGAPRFVMENVRFDSGETLVTGADGIAAVSLDTDRIVTLDSNSRVAFEKQSGSMKLTLEEGALLLDVQQKLSENETLDIQTSTMTVGIRGTIVYVTNRLSESGVGVTNTLGVLEGTAEVTYVNQSGIRQTVQIGKGSKAEIKGTAASEPVLDVQVQAMKAEDVPAFATSLPDGLSDTIQRVGDAIDQLAPSDDLLPDAADGAWTWNGAVTLVAQSASKLYDGKPLTRSADSLVYGLPAQFNISVTASGAQTDAGESDNEISSYTIYNSRGEDVTSHFSQIRTVSGKLVVDPAPLTVWTGSAEKVYDGLPLTCADAGVNAYPGYERNLTPWRNLSYVQTTAASEEVLFGTCGVTWVHGTNPLTGETREIALQTGEKLTVVLNEAEGAQSIEFIVERIPEEEIPKELLRLYANNPEVLAQACQDAGWDEQKLSALIAQLPEDDTALVTKSGLALPEADSERLMVDCTNVRIHVDTDITSYNDRALGSDEARYTPVSIPEDIVVTATGSRTEVGESPNTYTIDWGTSKPDNYILSEALGTLTVTAAPEDEPEETVETYDGAVRLTAASAGKTYDGAPLTDGGFEVAGLPEGFTVSATVTGSRTDAGSGENRISSYAIVDGSGRDVTGRFTNVSTESGTLTVRPAAVTVTTASAEKAYDGTPLNAEGAGITGLVAGEKAEVAATGSITDVGTAENGYVIDWGATNPDNYEVSEELGTLKITANESEITFTAASFSKTYDGTPLSVDVVVKSAAADAAETGTVIDEEPVAAAAVDSTEPDAVVTVEGLPEGLLFEAKVSASQLNAGSCAYSIDELTILDADGRDVTAYFTNIQTIEGTLTVAPAEATVVTGSADKAYDGAPLTDAEASITGLIEGETAAISASGSITDVGTVENGYVVDWGETNPANYTVSESLGTLTVTPAALTVTTGSASKVYDASPLTAAETSVSGLAEGEAITVTATGSVTDAGTAENGCIIDWGETNPDNYAITEQLGTLEVAKLPVVFSLCGYTCEYTGDVVLPDGLKSEDATLTETNVITDGMERDIGVEAVFTLPGGQVALSCLGFENVGSHTLSAEAEFLSGNPDNYAFSYADTAMTITPMVVNFYLHDGMNKVYNGETQIGAFSAYISALDFDVGYQIGSECGFIWGSDRITVDVTGGGKDAGDYALTGSYAIDSEHPENYSVVIHEANLTIVPAVATVTTGSASKTYDGKPLTSGTAEITGLVGSDTAVVTATGSITNVGTATNTYSIDWGDTSPDNYTLTESLGTLEVVRGDTIIITSRSAEKVYDGTPLTLAEYDIDGLPDNYDCAIAGGSIVGKQTDVGESENTIDVNGFTITDENGDVVDDSRVVFVKGKLKVTPATLTVTTGSATGLHDGMPLTSGEASIAGLVNGETAFVTATGSQTAVGESANTYEISWGTAKPENYTIVENLGTLHVTESTTPVTGSSWTTVSPMAALAASAPEAADEPETETIGTAEEPTETPEPEPTQAPVPDLTAEPIDSPADEPGAESEPEPTAEAGEEAETEPEADRELDSAEESAAESVEETGFENDGMPLDPVTAAPDPAQIEEPADELESEAVSAPGEAPGIRRESGEGGEPMADPEREPLAEPAAGEDAGSDA